MGEGRAGGTSETGGSGSAEPKRVRRRKKSPDGNALAPVPVTISPALTLPFKVGLNYFASFLPGGRESMMDLARLSDREKIRQVAILYDALPPDKRVGTVIEDLCAAVDATPTEFIGAIAGVAYSVNMDLGRMIAAMAQPEVLQAAIERAKTDEGFADRKMLLQATGLLPTSKPIQITQVNKQLAIGQIDAEGPSFEDVIQATAEVVRG